MVNHKRLVIKASVFLLFLGMTLPTISAAQKQITASIRVWPVKIEPVLKSDSSYKTEINVRNTSKYSAKITVDVQDFSRDEEGSYAFYAAGQRRSTFSAAKWVKLPAKQFSLKPNQEIKIPLSIKTPQKAEVGGHYAMAFIESTPIFDKSSIKGSYIIGKARVGVLNLITIKGKIIKKSNVKFELPRFNFSNSLPFAIAFNNQGNVHRDLAGVVTIEALGKKKKIAERSSLPYSNLVIRDKFSKLPLLGSYEARAIIKTKDGAQWLKEQTFYLIPLKLILGLIVGLLVITTAIFIFRKRFSIKIELKN